MLSDEELGALDRRVIDAGHLVVSGGLLLGVLLTVLIIKVTTGVPIDREGELHLVHEKVVRAAVMEAGGLEGQAAVCIALEGRSDPGDALLERIDDLGPLVLPVSDCDTGDLSHLSPTWYVTVRHVLWRGGGRAVVTAGSDRVRRYHLQRRRDGWHVVAVEVV